MSWGVNKRDRAQKLRLHTAVGAFLLYGIGVRFRAAGTLAEGGVCIPQADGDSSLDLLAMLIGPDAGEGLDQSGLAVIDMAHHADVYLRLEDGSLFCPGIGI